MGNGLSVLILDGGARAHAISAAYEKARKSGALLSRRETASSDTTGKKKFFLKNAT